MTQGGPPSGSGDTASGGGQKGKSVLAFFGIAVMVLGIVLVFGARLAAARRLQLERWGGNIFLAGLATWALHFVL
jgi:hypothetical protein